MFTGTAITAAETSANRTALLSKDTLDILKATLPAVASNLDKIVSTFYGNMLTAHPELFEFFNKTNQRTGRQGKALLESIVAYATNLEMLENLTPAVERIAAKHCALNIQPEQYQIVHDQLMGAIGKVLGDAVTPPVAKAWSEAVMSLAGILIKREAELYAETKNAPGGWLGQRDFVLDQKVDEADGISTLRLKSADGLPVKTPLVGQSISVVANPTKDPFLAPRHYTLTGHGEDYYEITPKRLHSESGAKEEDGVISNYLNDLSLGAHVRLFPPFGVPLLPPKEELASTTSILISSGIGVTPIVSVLPEIIKAGGKIALFHADSCSSAYAFRQKIDSIAGPTGALIKEYYSKPSPTDKELKNYCPGRLTAESIFKELEQGGITDLTKAHVFICTNPDLLCALGQELKAKGVTNIHDLNFGPHVQF